MILLFVVFILTLRCLVLTLCSYLLPCCCLPQINTQKRAASCISSDYTSIEANQDEKFESDSTVTKENEGDVSVLSTLGGSGLSFAGGFTSVETAKHVEILEAARRNNRISATKADSIKQILQSGSTPSDIVSSLLQEFIPKKRTKKDVDGEDKPKKGYTCKICLVPLKGHVCPYCEVCSTTEDKHLRDHECFNCQICFAKAKKVKKTLQLKKGHCKCEKEVEV